MPEIWQKFEKVWKFEKVRRDDDIFFNLGKMPKFWSLGLELQVSSSEFLMKSQSQNSNQVLVSEVTILTTSLSITSNMQLYVQPVWPWNNQKYNCSACVAIMNW